ncbi:MAG: iron chelate uptake ABC transporter family permease subunit [Advenella sp.]
MKSKILVLATIFFLMVASLFVGVSDVSLGSLFSDPLALNVFFTSRFPRTLALILTGASMSIAGLIMQMIMKNRFVEPSMVGTTQSATLGLIAVTLLYPGASLMLKMLVSCITALIGLYVFMLIARRLPPSAYLMLPLVGIIYGGVIGAAATFIAFEMDMMQFLAAWINGDFSSVLAGRYELLWLTGILGVTAYLFANQFTIAGLGKEMSTNLGLNYGTIVTIGLGIVAIITAIVVVTVGAIPFIGLVVPNIISRLMGDNLRVTLPWIAVMGAGLVLACDLIGRLANYPYEIPVGTIIGILGTLVFLYLLFVKPAHAR